MKVQAVLAGLLAIAGCKKTDNNAAGSSKVAAAIMPQKIEAPFDLKTPPADATRRPSGLIYKTITAAPSSPAPKRNDTVMIKYTGWRQASGESFFSNMKEDKPMPLNLAATARGFTEAMQLVRKGEKAMLWLPPEIGLKDQPAAGKPGGETLVYLVEVVDILDAPPVPTDLTTPPADARATKSGVKFVSLRPGTGKERARAFDEVTFNLTAWDAEGRMFDTTEMKKPAAKVPPFRQAAPMEEVLTSMVAGERVRFWVDAAKMVTPAAPQPNMPQGMLCYEVEILQIDKALAEPPPPPPDVAKPPGDARKTPAGVFYKVLATGKGGPKPKPSDTVKVHYTGWNTDGRMFDSSVIKNEPSQFGLQGVIKGWTDAIPLMSVGDKYRLWIPEELAYKNQPNRPQGMLVFEVELLEVKEAPPSPPPGHGAPSGHGAPPRPRPPGDDGHGH